MAPFKSSHLSTEFFDLTLGIGTSRGLFKAFGSGSIMGGRVVALTRLQGIPLLGGIVALVHFELVLVLARFIAIGILADFGAATLVVSVLLAIRDLRNVEDLGIITVVLL